MFLQSTVAHYNPQMSFDQVITDMSLSNPTFRLILGGFNCRSNSCWEGNISTKEGTDLESVSSSNGLHKLITDPTHILPQYPSCIDLIFIYEAYLVIESGAHSSSNTSCHHQITHLKLNLKLSPLQYASFTNLSITFRLWKRAPNFWICQKLLIGFGMRV